MARRSLPMLCLAVCLSLIATYPGIAKDASKYEGLASYRFKSGSRLPDVSPSQDWRERVPAYAALDTFVLAEFSFNPGGEPSAEGWVGVDMTAQLDTFCHVADASELDGGTFGRLVVLDGDQSLWCGAAPQSSGELCTYDMLPGYGNSWVQYFVSTPFQRRGEVVFSYLIRYDVEWDLDYIYVRYRRKPDQVCPGGCWEELTSYDDTSDGTVTEVFTIADSLLGDAVQFRFDFESDGAWSDEDGLWDTDGAFIIDNVTVSDSTGVLDFQDFESEPAGAVRTDDSHWSGDVLSPYGDFSGLFSGLSTLQEDPCKMNSGTVWGFFKGSTYDYSCGGYPEQPAVPYFRDEVYADVGSINNEIWSPPINWNTDINGAPVPPTAASALLEFDVYRDLARENSIMYTWDVRSLFFGCPSVWATDWRASPQALFPLLWGDGKDWYRERFEIGDLIQPDANQIQLALGVFDICRYYWLCGSECHSHAPLFDNVRVVRINTVGPIWRTQPGKVYKTHPTGYDLFQDNFAGDGTTTGTVRMDVPKGDWRDWCGYHQNPSFLPGDSATVTVSHIQGLAYHVPGDSSSGPAVYCHVKDVSPAKSGAVVSGDLSRWPVVATDADWTVLRCDYSYDPRDCNTHWITDEYCVDLNDYLYTPGDTIFYYFSARDANGNTNYWSEHTGVTLSEAHARANPIEVTCLPANALHGATDILYVDDFDQYGAQPFFESAFEILGITPDRYDVQRPAAFTGNGPGRRVVDVIQQLVGAYRIIIWNSGDLSAGLIGDGTGSPEVSDDFGMLFTFLDQNPNGPGLYISGDNVAAEWDTLTGPGAVDLRATYMNFDLDSGDHYAAGEPVSPLVVGQTGSCFEGSGGPDSLFAFGDCPGRNKFDVLAPTGASQLGMAYSNNLAHGAVLTQVTVNSVGDTARVALSGFSYHEIRDDCVQSPMDRVQHLLRILRWFDNEIEDPTAVPDGTFLGNELAQNYPNPFNPSTTIRYSIEKKGRVTLKIYNVAGKLVRTLVDGQQTPRAGGFSATWDGKSDQGDAVASGVYFYKLTAVNFEKTKKMVVLK